MEDPKDQNHFKTSYFEALGACEEFVIDYEKNSIDQKCGHFCLGACEVAQSLQARLAGSHGFYNRALDGGRCRGSFIKNIHHANEGPISEHYL